MRRAKLLASSMIVALAAGCTDEPKVDFSMDGELGSLEDAEANYEADDEFATLTENGAVKLGLTSDRVYLEASAALRRHIDREIAEGMEESDSRIARSISNAVRRGVQSALEVDIDFRLDEIEDVDYRDGELVFDFVDEDDRRRLNNIDIDDEPITRAFTEEDARAFVDAFRRVKSGEGVPEGVPSKGSRVDTTPAPDTAGKF